MKPGGTSRDKRINVRLDDSELAFFSQAASSVGMPLGTVAREALMYTAFEMCLPQARSKHGARGRARTPAEVLARARGRLLPLNGVLGKRG